MNTSPTTEQNELQLTDFQLGVERCMYKLSGRLKHCARSSYRHLRRASSLRELAPEMAAFCAITAEEEAATAVMFAIQKRRYKNCDSLDLKKHHQKASIYPFLRACGEVFGVLGDRDFQIVINETAERPKIILRIDISKFSRESGSEPILAEPIPPLNFSVSDQNGTLDLAQKFSEYANGKGFKEVSKYVKDQANKRNLLLYAADNGIAHVEIPKGYFEAFAEKITLLFAITVLIEQCKEEQLFVSQCLDAFLRIHRKLEAMQFEAPDELPPGPFLHIYTSDDETGVTSVGYRANAEIQYFWQPLLSVNLHNGISSILTWLS